MSASSKSFSIDLRAFVAKTKENMDEVTRAAINDIGNRLIKASPVGDRELWSENIVRAQHGLPLTPPGYVGGKFKNSWDCSVDGPPTALYRTPDATGAESTARIAAGIPTEAGGHVYFIANNQPYAVPLEDGHSTQAPLGIVGLTVFDWQQIVDAAVTTVRGS